MTLICCPACGYNKEVPAERLPPGLSRIKCPRCQHLFTHDPEQVVAAGTGAAPSAEPTTRVVCPHCQHEKQVPLSRIPPGRHQLRCWQCGEKFEYLQKQLSPARSAATAAADGQLPPVIDLFSRSWQLYKRRVWTLLGIYLLTVLAPVFLIGILAAVTVPFMAAAGAEPGFGTVLIGFLLLVLVAGLLNWGMVAMIIASVDATLGIRQALALGWQRFWAFGWLFFLLAFIVIGGFFLLLLPAFVFMTWFLFAQYILVDEDERGLAALLKSREYVRGYFWAVLLRLLVLWVAVFFLILLLGWIPLVGNLLQLLLFPFTLLYQFLVFHDIRQARGGRLRYFSTPRERLVWVGVAALGYLVVPVAFWLADVPGQFGQYLLAWQLQNRGYQVEEPRDGRQQAPEVFDEKLGPEPAAPLAINRSGYRKILNQARVPMAEGGVSLGPVAIRLDRFWTGAPPHQWLKVKVAGLPNLELAGDMTVKVRIDQVLGDGQSNQYDPTSMFEKDYFQQVELHALPEGDFEGQRDVYLRPGTSENEISQISGAVVLRLPLGIQTLTLTPSNMGEKFSLAGHTFTFKTMQDGTVELDFPGGLEPLLMVVGYNSDGQPLADAGTSWSEFDGVTSLSSHFQGELFSVKLIMAENFATEEYPFDLYP